MKNLACSACFPKKSSSWSSCNAFDLKFIILSTTLFMVKMIQEKRLRKALLLIDWCCFYYFVRNSLVALLEALCVRHNSSHSAWPWQSGANDLDKTESPSKINMCGVSTQQWLSTQITLCERTHQSAWLDAVTIPLTRSERILVYWNTFFVGGSSATKKSPKKTGNVLSDALMSRFQNFAADSTKKKLRSARFSLMNQFELIWGHSEKLFSLFIEYCHPLAHWVYATPKVSQSDCIKSRIFVPKERKTERFTSRDCVPRKLGSLANTCEVLIAENTDLPTNLCTWVTSGPKLAGGGRPPATAEGFRPMPSSQHEGKHTRSTIGIWGGL